MSEEPQKPEKPDQTLTGHLTLQGAGGACGYLMFKYLEYAHGYHMAAGDESMAGTFFGCTFFAFWWLFGPRIKRWRESQ